MKKSIFALLFLLLALTSCLVDGSWLNIVGRWQNIEHSNYEIEFTKGGRFNEYLNGTRVSYGEFVAEGKTITLHYLIPCGEGEQVDCYVDLRFTVTEETLILTDKSGDIAFKRIGSP